MYQDISVSKKEKLADPHHDPLTPASSVFPENEHPEPYFPEAEPGTLSQCSRPLQGLSKFAFAFISVPGLNSCISGDKNTNSLVTLSNPHLKPLSPIDTFQVQQSFFLLWSF